MRTHASTSVAGYSADCPHVGACSTRICATTEEKVAAVTLRYDIEWDKIRRAGEELAGGQKSPSTIEGMIRTKIEVGTNRIEWKLHIPEFKMRTQRIGFTFLRSQCVPNASYGTIRNFCRYDEVRSIPRVAWPLHREVERY